jgi:hypothetical protein
MKGKARELLSAASRLHVYAYVSEKSTFGAPIALKRYRSTLCRTVVLHERSTAIVYMFGIDASGRVWLDIAIFLQR